MDKTIIQLEAHRFYKPNRAWLSYFKKELAHVSNQFIGTSFFLNNRLNVGNKAEERISKRR